VNRRLVARIEGRVQGVGFRAFTARHGQRIHLAGTVRNLPDGAVELIAEGPAEKLQELLTQARRGPEGSVVSSVEVTWEEPTGNLRGFSVGY
jgi:acylphosphatase